MFEKIKIKLEYVLSIVIVLCILLWTFSGFIFPKNKDNTISSGNYALKSLAPVVKVKHIKLEQKSIAVSLHAIVDSSNIVDIKSEVTGRVSDVIAKDGSSIKKGDIIMVIDNERQKQAVEKSLALFEQRKTEYNTEEELVHKGYNAKVKLAVALTNLKEAQYILKNSEVDLDNTFIKSPMDGIVDKIPYSIGDMVSSVESVLTKVHALHDYTAHTFISEKQVLDVKTGTDASIVLANGTTISGTVSFVSNIADPDTKTYKVDLSFSSEDSVPVGMSAKVSFPLKIFDAYYVENNSIFLDDYGVVGIKILDAKNIVNFIPVDILSEENGGFWVEPKLHIDSEVVLVTLGGNFVKHGDLASL